MLRARLTCLGKLVRQLKAYGDTYEHAEPGLLGNQRADRAGALLLVLLTHDAAHLGVVRLAEPAAFAERFGEYPLESRRRVHNDILRVREASRFDQRLKRPVNLGSRIGAVWQSHPMIGGTRAQTVLVRSNRPHAAQPSSCGSNHSRAAQTVFARLKPKPSVRPSAAPVTPASQLTSGRAYGIASSTAAIAAVASRSPS